MEYIEPNSERWLSLEDLPSEEWKDIKGYEGLYQISNYGRVKSLDKWVSYGHHYLGKILRCAYDKDGYIKVSLCKNGKQTNCRVHQLVGEYFVPNPEHKPLFDHIKPVKKGFCDNRYTNLRPATYSENNRYAYVNGRKPSLNGKGKLGKDNPCSVKIMQYDLDFNIIRVWNSFQDVTRQLGFSHGNLVSCCKGRYKQAYGYIWRYVKEEDNE